MDQLTENRPETCASVGLDCGTCIRQSAATVADLCRDLEPSGIRQIFFHLYPSSGCHPMLQTFELSCLEAAIPHKPMVRAGAAAA